jgi:cardiolipin synthase A/B
MARFLSRVALAVVALWGLIVLAGFFKGQAPPKNSPPPVGACNDACALIIEPDEGIAPVLALINGASRSIDLVMYELEDNAIESALAAAEKRGVSVRVLLSPGYQGEPSAVNDAAYETLRALGVAVHWSPDHFALTHEKSLVVDANEALIMSFNFVPKFYPTGRDFGVIDRDKKDVAATESTFNVDWEGSGATAPVGKDLVWSPGSRIALIQLIESAQASLDIYNEEMADAVVTNALIRAAERGIVVRVVMTYSPDWKTAFGELVAHGVVVKTYPAHAALYIHAKMIVADNARAFVGSENFSLTSLDKNRELGIIIINTNIIQSLESTFENDLSGATMFKKK